MRMKTRQRKPSPPASQAARFDKPAGRVLACAVTMKRFRMTAALDDLVVARGDMP
jgi:hypothetical protein